MTRFFKVFLKDRLDGAVLVAGFGKHPAWDDHIDDIGLATETLAIAKQLLYSEGIARQLASGAWDQIENSGHALKFDHRFLWARHKQAVVGAIWSSVDGKGRTRFPMVICIQAETDGVRAIWYYLPPVERLGTLCKAASTQETFRAALRQSQTELNSGRLTAEVPYQSADGLPEDEIVPALIGLSHLLGSKRKRGAIEGGRRGGLHIRLPAVSSLPQTNLDFWSRYLAWRAFSHAPYLAITASGKEAVDLIVGEPESSHFYCLRADKAALPIASPNVEAGREQKLEAEAKEYLQWLKAGSNPIPKRRSLWFWGRG